MKMKKYIRQDYNIEMDDIKSHESLKKLYPDDSKNRKLKNESNKINFEKLNLINEMKKKNNQNELYTQKTVKEQSTYINSMINNLIEIYRTDYNKYSNSNLTKYVDENSITIFQKQLTNYSDYNSNYETCIDELEEDDRKLKKFENVYDSASSDEYDSDYFEKGRLVINDNWLFKKIWDFIMILCIIYSCVIEPYTTAFSITSYYGFISDVLIDIFFILDIILNFFIPYYQEEKLITNSKKIAARYFKGTFIIDFISSIPNSFNFIKGSGINSIRGILKMTRIYRILNNIRMKHLMKLTGATSLGNLLNYNPSFTRITKFCFIFIILVHMSNCIWIYLAELESMMSISWISYYDLQDSNNFDKYIASFYFNLVTIYTIGYGDIAAKTTNERIYNIFLMTIGVFLFSYTVSSLSEIFATMTENKKAIKNKNKIFLDIRKEYKIPKKLNEKIHKNIKFSKRVGFENFDLFETLPVALRKEVIVNLHKHRMKNLKFFFERDREFFLFTLPLLKAIKIYKNESIIEIGDFVEEMFIVQRGTLALKIENIYDNIEIGQIGINNHFGEVYMYTNEVSNFLLDVKSLNCDLITLRKDDFLQIYKSFSQIVSDILKTSWKFLEKCEKLKHVVIEFLRLGTPLKKIKAYLKKLNYYLLKKQFDVSFSLDKMNDLSEAEDFILEHDLKSIMKFLKTDMTPNDYSIIFSEQEKVRISPKRAENFKRLDVISKKISTERIDEEESHKKLNTDLFFKTKTKLNNSKKCDNKLNIPTRISHSNTFIIKNKEQIKNEEKKTHITNINNTTNNTTYINTILDFGSSSIDLNSKPLSNNIKKKQILEVDKSESFKIEANLKKNYKEDKELQICEGYSIKYSFNKFEIENDHTDTTTADEIFKDEEKPKIYDSSAITVKAPDNYKEKSSNIKLKDESDKKSKEENVEDDYNNCFFIDNQMKAFTDRSNEIKNGNNNIETINNYVPSFIYNRKDLDHHDLSFSLKDSISKEILRNHATVALRKLENISKMIKKEKIGLG